MTTEEIFSSDNPNFRSGFAALLGDPNVGKSTLVNALLDFKLAIVSPKAQTTRDKIHAIYTDSECQLIFVDTPGVMEPQDSFNVCLRDRALEALEGADVVLHLVDAQSPQFLPSEARRALLKLKKPVLLIVNKCDLLEGYDVSLDTDALNALLQFPFDTEFYDQIICVSALQRQGLKQLVQAVSARMPLGPPLYETDQYTDRSMRFLASEIVREKVLENCHQEVPYSVATVTEEFQERTQGKYLVRVVIFVETPSQKGIVIGRGGSMLRTIGSEARPEIEQLADHAIFLELFVKVRRNWRKKAHDLQEFGYETIASGKKKKKKRSRR